MEQRKGRRLILFPMPFQGHMNPMLRLGQILHSKGFAITVIHTNFNSPDASNYPHFTFRAIPDGLDQLDPVTSSNALYLINHLNKMCVCPLEDCLVELISDGTDEPIGCLVSDALFHFTQGVSERLRIPRIVLRTGGACSFHVFASFPFLKEKGYLPVQESKLEDPIMEIPPLKVKDLPVVDSANPEEVHLLVTSMVSSAKNCTALIFNTFEELELSPLNKIRREFPVPVFPIGPFHKLCPHSSSGFVSDDEACNSWLDKQETGSVIYVSFGSIVSVKQSDYEEIAWGLRNSGRPFLWVIRPGSFDGMDELSGLLEKGLIMKWAPQVKVLSHRSIGAFWTHCGWNSTLESISEGIPMICMPCFTDQKVNSRFLCDVWRVGVELELVNNNRLERGKIEKAIQRLFDGKEGEEIRTRALHLKEKASLCLEEGGSSIQSIGSLADHVLSIESLTFGAGAPSV